MWAEAKMREDLTNSEILALFNEKFPFVQGITERHIASYRKRYVPFYQDLILARYGKKSESQLPASVEEEILAEVREAEETGEEFTKEEARKINMIKAFRAVLKEMWLNYRAVKTTKDEQSKRGYLVEILKALSAIKELEQAEKSFISAIDEIRKAEQKLTPEQLLESIETWHFLRLAEKAQDKGKVTALVDSLIGFLQNYKVLLNSLASVEDANKEILAKVFVNEKIKKEEGE